MISNTTPPNHVMFSFQINQELVDIGWTTDTGTVDEDSFMTADEDVVVFTFVALGVGVLEGDGVLGLAIDVTLSTVGETGFSLSCLFCFSQSLLCRSQSLC